MSKEPRAKSPVSCSRLLSIGLDPSGLSSSKPDLLMDAGVETILPVLMAIMFCTVPAFFFCGDDVSTRKEEPPAAPPLPFPGPFIVGSEFMGFSPRPLRPPVGVIIEVDGTVKVADAVSMITEYDVELQ